MINGDRVRQVRELLGLTQKQFAEYISVTQPEIAQIENGGITPGEEVLQKIILKTGFPLSFFKQATSVEFPLGSLLFRARQAASAREKSEARQYARTIFEVVEKLEKNVDRLSIYLPRLDDEPVGAAIKVRSALGLSPDMPIDNLIQTIEKNGVLVLALPTNIQKTDAFSAWVGSEYKRPVIAITNSSVSGDRLRFSIAHELGHLVIHQATIGNTKKMENDANVFAGEFLIPKEAMLKEITTPVTLVGLLHLKARWKVSVQMLVRRCYDLQIITQRQYKYLMQQISIRGWKKDEPVKIGSEKPRFLGQVTEMLYGIPIDYKQLASQLNLPPRIIKGILEVHAIKNGSLANNGMKSIGNNVINFNPRKN